MSICERTKVESEPCTRRDHAARQDSTGKDSPPRFLTQAWGWVEFRRIALRRQRCYLLDSSGQHAGGPGTGPGAALAL